MPKLLNDILTGRDGKTYDIARVCLLVGAVVFFGLTIVNYDKFDAVDFGTGFGLVLAGAGIGIGMKAKTEPEE